MQYQVLACDYDGTLAHDGIVHDSVVDALRRLRASGRRLLLVTGRELADLSRIFTHLDLFEYLVCENGATLVSPATLAERPLAERPPEKFIEALRSQGVAPMSVGRVVVAVWSPYENVVLDTIHDFGLELQVIFNKGAVMVLPSGVNKATGLAAALAEMKLSPEQVVAVGDAENDHALLDCAGIGAAVANSVPMLKERADLVLEGDHGAGVIELVDRILATDLAEVPRRPRAKV